MASYRKESISRLGFKTVLGVVLIYLLATVGYYHLPWSVRDSISNRFPSLNRALMKQGFAILQGWDELALTGGDADVRMEDSFRGDQVYGGWPIADAVSGGRIRRLENRGYTVGYSDTIQNPLWVAYRIFDLPKLQAGERKSYFPIDQRTRAEVSHDDYTHSGYDRGHMAPNYGIATRYGREAQLETYLMSNIIPQNPEVNRYIWKDLEMRVAKRYGRYFREVWVITGPVFEGRIRRLDSGVPIPTAYYKIIVDENGDHLRALAFLVDEKSRPYTRIRTCLVSIDQLESLTGLDFFPDLPVAMETELEAEAATRLWPWIGPSMAYHLFGKTR